MPVDVADKLSDGHDGERGGNGHYVFTKPRQGSEQLRWSRKGSKKVVQMGGLLDVSIANSLRRRTQTVHTITSVNEMANLPLPEAIRLDVMPPLPM